VGSRGGVVGMTTIEFDDGAADALIAAADGASSDLGEQAFTNRFSVEGVVADFKGAYATLFTQANIVRSEDTLSLTGVLTDLMTAVGESRRQADDERQRLSDLSDWKKREAERERQRGSGDVLQESSAFVSELVDRRPSEVPIRATPISVAYSARERNRTRGGASGGTSSADPDVLRTFVGMSRASDLSTAQHVIQMKNAWTRFASACSWVPIESSTAITSLDTLMAENALDATWIEGIAAEFDAAGGASLPDLRLDGVVITAASPALTKLLQPGLTPAEVAEAYALLPQSDAYIEGLPLVAQYFLANLDGVPAVSRDVASRAVLDAAVANPEAVAQLMGIVPDGPLAEQDFEEQVVALRKAVDQADLTAKELLGQDGASSIAQLVGFGVHDGAVVAAISLGDLDTASNVTVNVPGMKSNAGEMKSALTAADELVRAAVRGNPDASYAVVSWMGYNSPSEFEVASPARALSGAAELASFMDGLHDSRADVPADSYSVMAHSYGSTTTSEALLLTQHRVDSFISYGSVGLTNEATVYDLNADEVYATQAWGDGLAPVGLALGLGTRTNPTILDGVHVFSSGAGPGTEAVTQHDMFLDSGSDQNGYLSADTTSLKTISQIVANGRPD